MTSNGRGTKGIKDDQRAVVLPKAGHGKAPVARELDVRQRLARFTYLGYHRE